VARGYLEWIYLSRNRFFLEVSGRSCSKRISLRGIWLNILKDEKIGRRIVL